MLINVWYTHVDSGKIPVVFRYIWNTWIMVVDKIILRKPNITNYMTYNPTCSKDHIWKQTNPVSINCLAWGEPTAKEILLQPPVLQPYCTCTPLHFEIRILNWSPNRILTAKYPKKILFLLHIIPNFTLLALYQKQKWTKSNFIQFDFFSVKLAIFYHKIYLCMYLEPKHHRKWLLLCYKVMHWNFILIH